MGDADNGLCGHLLLRLSVDICVFYTYVHYMWVCLEEATLHFLLLKVKEKKKIVSTK